ncbi:SAM-dependent methyltransferase [Streptomyces odontomachi]|uniref:SAM-dependent methyltransferase n=1 Tax=Streptomyces odontomachi TaxID=2944940 RepID=UPI002108CB7F|nr:class I SAM-dependent methyltransferase [Streptomyces sp. ODS25]
MATPRQELLSTAAQSTLAASPEQNADPDAAEPAVMGDHHHRAWVGPPEYYDRLGAMQFVVLLLLGMRETDRLLDLGCGSLRGGRFSLVYLRPGNYHGIDPAQWCVEQGVAAELGDDILRLKRPAFRHNDDFDARPFGRAFDYVMASGIFMHAAPHQVRQCMEQVAHVLADDGLFVGAFLPGAEDSTAKTWTYPEIQRYTPERLAEWAGEAGLRLSLIDAPHTLDHRWFVATRATSDRRLPARLTLDAFTWTRYLVEQIESRGGTARSHDDYLKEELNKHLTEDNDMGLMPQARI